MLCVFFCYESWFEVKGKLAADFEPQHKKVHSIQESQELNRFWRAAKQCKSHLQLPVLCLSNFGVPFPPCQSPSPGTDLPAHWARCDSSNVWGLVQDLVMRLFFDIVHPNSFEQLECFRIQATNNGHWNQNVGLCDNRVVHQTPPGCGTESRDEGPVLYNEPKKLGGSQVGQIGNQWLGFRTVSLEPSWKPRKLRHSGSGKRAPRKTEENPTCARGSWSTWPSKQLGYLAIMGLKWLNLDRKWWLFDATWHLSFSQQSPDMFFPPVSGPNMALTLKMWMPRCGRPPASGGPNPGIFRSRRLWRTTMWTWPSCYWNLEPIQAWKTDAWKMLSWSTGIGVDVVPNLWLQTPLEVKAIVLTITVIPMHCASRCSYFIGRPVRKAVWVCKEPWLPPWLAADAVIN